jgi:hypothetical protein
MKEWTWPSVAALAIVTAGIVVMYGQSPDQSSRDKLLLLFEALVGLIVGVSAGAAVGYARGWRAGVRAGREGTI